MWPGRTWMHSTAVTSGSNPFLVNTSHGHMNTHLSLHKVSLYIWLIQTAGGSVHHSISGITYHTSCHCPCVEAIEWSGWMHYTTPYQSPHSTPLQTYPTTQTCRSLELAFFITHISVNCYAAATALLTPPLLCLLCIFFLFYRAYMCGRCVHTCVQVTGWVACVHG